MNPTIAKRVAEVDEAFSNFAGALVVLDDAAMRNASLVPGWSRAHVVVNIALRADSNRATVEGAISGVESATCPTTAEQLEGDIKLAAMHEPAEIVVQCLDSHALLMGAWGRVADDGWQRTGEFLGEGPCSIEHSLELHLSELVAGRTNLNG
ncbi:MAG: hypothetical protein EXQ69_04685 [Acidimicrobiia bacterium]|nr:hypothetical protein [Acidimicrobiia bacterium]